MKKLFTTLVLFIVFTNNSYSDPVPYTDDWKLLDRSIVSELKFKNSNYELSLMVKNNELVLISNNKSKKIYQLNNDKFDVYIISKDSEPLIYLFNKTQKKLYVANPKNINVKFISQSWDFGVLEAIIKNCEKPEGYRMDKYEDNYMVSKFTYKKRPKKYKCGYLLSGGRCELVFNPKTNEYKYNDKMIIKDNFKYEGDIASINYLLGGDEYGPICTFYNKLSI